MLKSKHAFGRYTVTWCMFALGIYFHKTHDCLQFIIYYKL